MTYAFAVVRLAPEYQAAIVWHLLWCHHKHAFEVICDGDTGDRQVHFNERALRCLLAHSFKFN